MNIQYFNQKGENIIHSLDNTPFLGIVWGKAFGEIYCHHAYFSAPISNTSPSQSEYAKICVFVRQNIIEKGKITRFSDSSVSSFLKADMNSGRMNIPLNSPEILDALCENGWTSLKDGKRGAPKSFPLSFGFSINDEEMSIFNFSHETGKFPFTISEGLFSTMKEEDKIETIIFLS